MRILYVLVFLNSFLFAQTIPAFPADQHSYLGGEVNFYKDFQKILLEKQLKPCTNKKEHLKAVIVVKTDDTAELYSDENTPQKDSKCAEALTAEVVKLMPGWVAAKIDGKNTVALTHYFIYPDAFFDNFETGYTPDNYFKMPVFPGGIQAFRKEVDNRADGSGFYVKGDGKVTLTVMFTVNEEGIMENAMLENSSGLEQYDEMILYSVKSIKKKWTPATIHGVATKYRFRMPISYTNQR